MSGETQASESGWTTDTLRYATERRFADLVVMLNERAVAQDKAVQAALLATKEAIAKAEAASDKRFESVNEFRAQLADQANTFMPRAESDTRYTALTDRIDRMERTLSTIQGQDVGVSTQRSDQRQLLNLVVAAMGLIVIILSTGLAVVVAQ